MPSSLSRSLLGFASASSSETVVLSTHQVRAGAIERRFRTPSGLTGEDVQLQRGEVLERVDDGLDEVDIGLQLVEDDVKDGDGEAVAELAEVAARLLDVFGSQAPGPTAIKPKCTPLPRCQPFISPNERARAADAHRMILRASFSAAALASMRIGTEDATSVFHLAYSR